MSDPQIWTIIAVFATFSIGALGGILTLATRTIRTEISSVRTELRTEVGALRTEMNARFDTVDVRIAHLDADVAALARRVMGDQA